MTDSSKATIYLADERGVDEEDSFRSHQTFNYGKFFNEYKTPFGNLYLLNDDTLGGGRSIKMKVPESSCFVLLPVVGAIDYKDSLGNESLINAGEIQMIELPEGTDFELLNPYENDLVNYIQFWLRIPVIEIRSVPLILDFNLVSNKNKLLKITNDLPHYVKVSIGQFTGRKEALYQLKDTNKGLFIFVIEGAFEVAGRLLHPRDGLALWDVNGSVDLEALSNEAIVLLLEPDCD